MKRRLTKKAVEILTRAAEDFEEALRRPPRDGDRVFFWAYAQSQKEIKDQTIETMLRAGIRQELIYIYDKTGFTVTKSGWNKLTRQEKNEIQEAGEAYELARAKAGKNLYEAEDYAEFNTKRDEAFVAIFISWGILSTET